MPIGGTIDPGCADALRELERRGYPVWRVRGYAAIDAARNQMASDALAQGFDELMWIDADVVFQAEDVDKLRGHNIPLVCGIYAKKSCRQFACSFLPQTRQIVFGGKGGLIEILYCGFGFVHTRRIVYETMQRQLNLPHCNRRFGENMVPYFCAAGRWRGGASLVSGRGLRLLRTCPPVRLPGHGRYPHPSVACRNLSLRLGRRWTAGGTLPQFQLPGPRCCRARRSGFPA